MADDILQKIMNQLEFMRDDLAVRVACLYETGLAQMPGVDPTLPRPVLDHQAVLSTVYRFHNGLRAAVLLDWVLIQSDYAWAGQVLTRRGVTWEHQRLLIEIYFDQIAQMHPWSCEERETLDLISRHLTDLARSAYCDAAAVLA